MANQHLASIVKLFETCRYRHDIYQVFSDWCECAAIAMSNAMDIRQREKREARYLDIVKRYTKEELATFPQIFGEVTMALEAAPQDILGATFHELELHNKARGQFFTPYELCRMMAKINAGTAEDLQAIIDKRGYITAQEPAVGAGATIIALAEAIKDLGVNYQQHLHVTAVDIDPRAVHMAYVQFSLLHIPAQVIVGDTLRLEFREDWFTPAHIMGFWTGRLAADRATEHAAAPITPTQVTPIRSPLAKRRAPPRPPPPDHPFSISVFDRMPAAARRFFYANLRRTACRKSYPFSPQKTRPRSSTGRNSPIGLPCLPGSARVRCTRSSAMSVSRQRQAGWPSSPRTHRFRRKRL